MDESDDGDRDVWSELDAMSIEAVLLAWRQHASQVDPWRSMPLDDQTGELRRVLDELLDLAGGINTAARRRRIRRVAGRHGAFRRAQRCPDGTLREDFAVLRLAMRRVLHTRAGADPAGRATTLVLLLDIAVAQRAALEAYAGVHE